MVTQATCGFIKTHGFELTQFGLSQADLDEAARAADAEAYGT